MSDSENKGRIIDLDNILAIKFPGKRMPGWLVKVLKRYLRIDYINGFLEKGYEGVEFCTKSMEYMGVTLEVYGLENIPADGTKYTFASNHPLGGMDGAAMTGVIGSRFGDVGLLVNDFLMSIPGLRPMCVPINKIGSQARNLPQMLNNVFQSEKQILIFPAGLCSRKIDGKVQDLAWTKTFISKSIESGRKIVPVHFQARNSARFYRVAALRKFLGIKFNIEMSLLPDELYKSRNKTFRIVFGKPIDPSVFDKSKTPLEWAAFVREIAYSL